MSLSDIPRAENVKSPSLVKLEYYYYKLMISFPTPVKLSLKKKKKKWESVIPGGWHVQLSMVSFSFD